MSRINVGNTCGLGATPVSGTAGDSVSVATEVGGMEVAVAGVVGEGAVVMITVRVGSGTPHPKANTIREGPPLLMESIGWPSKNTPVSKPLVKSRRRLRYINYLRSSRCML